MTVPVTTNNQNRRYVVSTTYEYFGRSIDQISSDLGHQTSEHAVVLDDGRSPANKGGNVPRRNDGGRITRIAVPAVDPRARRGVLE